MKMKEVTKIKKKKVVLVEQREMWRQARDICLGQVRYDGQSSAERSCRAVSGAPSDGVVAEW